MQLNDSHSIAKFAAALLIGAAVLSAEKTVAANEDIPAALIHYADLVLFNGQILTVDQEFSVAEAIAVRDGKVLAIGNDEEILALAGPDTQRHGSRASISYTGLHL